MHHAEQLFPRVQTDKKIVRVSVHGVGGGFDVDAFFRYFQKGAVFVGILKRFHKRLQGRVGKILRATGRKTLKMPDVRLHVAAEKAAIVLPRLHHDRKIGKLSGAFIEVKSVEILFHNQPDRFPHGIAASLINLHQHVKEIAQNMPRTHAGVYRSAVFDTKPICNFYGKRA